MSLEDLQRLSVASDVFTQEGGGTQELFPNTERTVTVKFQLANHAGLKGAGVSVLRKREKRI